MLQGHCQPLSASHTAGSLGRRGKEEMLSSHHLLDPMLLLLLLLLVLQVLSPSASAQTYHNISLGSNLTTSGTTTSWLSPSGEFAVGFLPLPTNSTLFLLAIWFTKTKEKTIVWYANGNRPVLSGSLFGLTSDGQFLLTDSNGNSIWNTFPSIGSSYAALLDTGNLILASADSTTNWQSFNAPKDTILPIQNLPMNTKLRSHLDDDNYTDGRYEFSMQGDGNLVMYPLALPTDSVYSAYWSTMTVNNGSQVVFDPSGTTLYLELVNKSRINVTTSTVSTAEFYQRVTLDPDGVLRHYVYPKDAEKSGSWSNDWTVVASLPSDICQIANVEIGSGACGFNSYCQPGQNKPRSCRCPPSYSFLDPSNPSNGCKPDFVPPSCGGGDQEYFELREMPNINWSGSDYEHYGSFNEDKCRENCMNDCFCMVAVVSSTGCWKKRLPLSNGRIESYGGKAFIKVGIRNTSSSSPSPEQQSDQKNEKECQKVWLLVGLSSLTISLIILFGSVTALVVLSSSYKRTFLLDSSIAGSTLRCFTYKELEEATNGFTKELGRGAFGIVYQGFLPPEPKICVAVKKLDKLLPEREKEFMAEVRSIGQTHHKNLVRLLGYCNEGVNRLLVYEFMSNGSLTAFLFQGPRPGWSKRVEIVLGIARGLLYLHEECKTLIIHCDIKPQNILLDDELTTRISDFGLAKLLGPDQTRTNTGIRGTKGYVAPEWFRNMPITAKVDVYSFGVMLLEIICCRRNLELELPREEETVLVYWAYDCYRQGRVDALVGNDEEAMGDFDGVLRLLMVAIWCIQEDPSIRPTMKRVWQMLDCAIVVPAPPDPYLIN